MTRFAAWDAGEPVTVACVNEANSPLGVDFDALIQASQEVMDTIFSPVWKQQVNVVKCDPSNVPDGAWLMAMLDDADQAGALGYHDLTAAGQPLAKVFARTTISDGEMVSVTWTHELFEMAADPDISWGKAAPDGSWYALEVSDAVERQSFDHNGILISNFVYPSWFESFRQSPSGYDYMGGCSQPYQILQGGYMPVQKNGQWTQIFGQHPAAAHDALAFKLAHHHRVMARCHGKTKVRSFARKAA